MIGKSKRQGRKALNDYRSAAYSFRVSSRDYQYQDWLQSQVEALIEDSEREGHEMGRSAAITALIKQLIDYATEGKLQNPVPVLVTPITPSVDVTALKAEILNELQAWAKSNLSHVVSNGAYMTADEVLETVSDDVIDNILNGMERR